MLSLMNRRIAALPHKCSIKTTISSKVHGGEILKLFQANCVSRGCTYNARSIHSSRVSFNAVSKETCI